MAFSILCFYIVSSPFPRFVLSTMSSCPHFLMSTCLWLVPGHMSSFPHVLMSTWFVLMPLGLASGSCLWVLPLGLTGQRLLLSVWPALLPGCSSRGRLLMEEIPSSLPLCGAGEGTLLFVPSVVTLNTSIMAGFSNFTD